MGKARSQAKSATSKSTKQRTTRKRSGERSSAAKPKAPNAAPPQSPWAALGLAPELVDAVNAAKFEKPSDIQAELIPVALTGRDCIGQARTGTGKTAAFTIPMLQRLMPGDGLQALVLAPTRELAVQVDEHISMIGRQLPFKTVTLVGGRGLKTQLTALAKNPEIAIGTPGRILDLLGRRNLKFDTLRIVILDEVDRMLDIGFRDDIRRILSKVKAERQTIFVSATIDDEIRRLAKTYMKDPVELDVSRDVLTVETVKQGFITVHPIDKFPALLALLREEKPSLAIVFTRTKAKARRLSSSLRDEGINCKEIHGDLVQQRRERVMKSFRDQKTHVLVATDLASRGLDVMAISHIINYDIPEDASVYVHRIGRTARMGQAGQAYTFVTPDQGKLLTDVEKLINREVPSLEPPWLKRSKPVPKARTEADIAPRQPKERPDAPERYRTARSADPVLDSLGLRPIPRTLGSRFRTARKRR
jgi:ATP-dependent RNA helicase DeaD